MNLLQVTKFPLPKDLDAIIDVGQEDSPALCGLTTQHVERIWQALIALYLTGNSPMISVCIRRHGKIMLNRTIGYAQFNPLEKDQHANTDIATNKTPVCLFSASKLMTAMCVHVLYEKLLLNIDDPIAEYLPEYAVRGKENTTIEHLLRHQAGIPFPSDLSNTDLLFDYDGCYRMLCKQKPVSKPGKKTYYHGITSGYVLGKLVERISGQLLTQFMRDTFEKPMGLSCFNYGVKHELRPTVALNMATGLNPKLGTNQYLKHVLGGNLQQAVDLTNDPRFLSTICPSGNMYSTAFETTTFLEMLLNNGVHHQAGIDVKILKPETIQNAIRPIFSGIDRGLLVPMRYGAGVMLGQNPIGLFGGMSRASFGHIGFSNNFCYVDPVRDMSVTILCTGKSVIGTHLPALVQFMKMLFTECAPIDHSLRRGFFQFA